MKKWGKKIIMFVAFFVASTYAWSGEIHDAVRQGDIEKVQALLKQDIKLLNSKDESGSTPLHGAAEHGHIALVKLLLEKGADLNAGDNEDSLPLHVAALGGHKEIVDFLIAKGALMNDQDDNGMTALHFAAVRGHKNVVDFLIAKGANYNLKTTRGMIPLHLAAVRGHLNVVELLISRGSDKDAKDKYDFTALHLASLRGHREIANLLIEQQAAIDAKADEDKTALHFAAWGGHTGVVKLLVGAGAEVNTKDYSGDMPLHGAAYSGHKEVVELLLAEGAEVNRKNSGGATPLHNASRRGHKEIADLLLAKGAKLSAHQEKDSKDRSDCDKETIEPIKSVKITILYDNYVFAEGTKSDWGFSCLVEGTEKTILFDTGTRPEILFHNIGKLQVNLSNVEQIVISHNHGDHTGGLFSVLEKNPNVSVYLPYSFPYEFVRRVEKAGANVVAVKEPKKICENVFLTGEMGDRIKEHSLILYTQKGMIVITGCSHPGIVNILKKSKEVLNKKIYLVFGGFHLMRHSEAELKNIIREFKNLGVIHCGATHCTGDKAIRLFKEAFGENYVEMGTGRILEITESGIK